MAIREGRWDCPSCGEKGVRGRETVCPSCGKPRGDDVDFYLPAAEPEVTDAARLAEAEGGADWHCEHCGSDNRAGATHCRQCGAERGSSPGRQEQLYGVGAEPQTGEDATELVEARDQAEEAAAQRAAGSGVPGYAETGHYQAPAAEAVRSGSRALRHPAFLIGIAVTAFLILVRLLTATHAVPLTVTGHRWERTVAVEHHVTVREEDWAVPNGGRVRGTSSRVHHYDHPLDHYETRSRTVTVQTGTRTERYKSGTRSKGNGYFEDVYSTREVPVYGTKQESYQEPVYRNDPIYQTWYAYDIERWKPARTPASTGTDLSPEWPEMHLAGNERESGRTEKYRCFFTDAKGKQYSLELPLDRWKSWEGGTHVRGTMNVIGQLLAVSDH